MLLETHSHTREYSDCSHIPALTLAQEVRDKGLQGLVLTDHHHVWTPKDLARLRKEAKLEEHFVLLSGQEVTTSDSGDILVFGPTKAIQKQSRLSDILRKHPEAAVVWGKVLVRARLKDYIPLFVKYFDEDLRLARTMTFSQVSELGGRLIPAVVTMVPEEKPEESTIIHYEKMDFDIDLKDDFFSLRTLQK